MFIPNVTGFIQNQNNNNNNNNNNNTGVPITPAFTSSSLSTSLLSNSSHPQSSNIALEECISRIKKMIQQVQLGIPNENTQLNKFACPITLETPKDLVVTNCGHIYERVAIKEWTNKGGLCTLCKTPITTLSPIHELNNLIQDWQKECPIPTFSNCSPPCTRRAGKYLEIAKSAVDEKAYKEALELYKLAIQYTRSSTVYANIPPLYDLLGESEKATLSRLYLSLYQLQEGKIQEAINTLHRCRSNSLNVNTIVLGLTLQSCLEWTKNCALNQNNLEDRIFLCKQIISQAPNQFDAHKQLISLTTNPEEKRSLLLRAAHLAHIAQQLDWKISFLKEAGIPLLSSAISKKEWAAPQFANLPPYPQALKDFLSGDCAIWPGKKRAETHIVVPLFPQVDINGSLVPLTLDSLDQLDKSSGGTGFSHIWNEIPKDLPVEKEFHYAVMTTDVIPGSKNKPHDQQVRLLPTGYEAPGVRGAATAILWDNRCSGRRCFSDNPSVYTSCKELIQGCRSAVGNFNNSHLVITSDDNGSGDACLGMAGWREF